VAKRRGRAVPVRAARATELRRCAPVAAVAVARRRPGLERSPVSRSFSCWSASPDVDAVPVRARFWLALGVMGCASGSGRTGQHEGDPSAHECALRLAPRSQPLPRPPGRPPVRTVAKSQIVVHAEAPLEPLKRTLESRVQTRLAEGRFGIGPGGTVSYSAERGALSLSVTQSALVIEAPVRARAQACRGERCYASCEPEARVRAEVSLMLRPDYGFAPARVSLRFSRGCKVRALGGLLTIDVTPTLEAQLEPELRQAAREIDRQMPNLRAEADKAWSELSAQRSVPLLGCLVLSPSGLVQGPLQPSTERLRARFALLATPELRSECPSVAPAQPLPPLRTDPSLLEEGTIFLGMVTPLENVARALQAGPASEVSGKKLRVAEANVTARGSDVDIELRLAGEVCGNVALTAEPDFAGEREVIGLTRAQLAESEQQRLTSADVDPLALARALQATPRLQPLLSPRGLRESAQALARAGSQPSVTVSAKVSSARAAGASARDHELVAWLEARGSLSLQWSAIPQR